MADQRLPIVNSDDGVWGDILRQFMEKEHVNDDTNNPLNGGHRRITVQAGTTGANTAPIKLSSGALMTTPEVGAIEFLTDHVYFTITAGTARKKVALYDDTSGATGDIYYRNSSGYFSRIGVGANGKTLRVASGTPTWADASFATATKTADYTITATDTVILADASAGNVTVTLPVAADLPGYRFYVKRVDASPHPCIVARTASDTIDGETSQSLTLQYTSLTLASNGSNWYII